MDKGLIKDYADLYTLGFDDLNGLEQVSDEGQKRSFQKRSAHRLLEAIEASKKIPFEKVLFAIGIRRRWAIQRQKK